MKTAILFTGFVRSYANYDERLHIALLKAFPNADLYFCLWDIIDLSNTTKVDLNKLASKCKSMKVLNWDFHKKIGRAHV